MEKVDRETALIMAAILVAGGKTETALPVVFKLAKQIEAGEPKASKTKKRGDTDIKF